MTESRINYVRWKLDVNERFIRTVMALHTRAYNIKQQAVDSKRGMCFNFILPSSTKKARYHSLGVIA